MVKGEDLRLNKFNLENTEINVEGEIISMVYNDKVHLKFSKNLYKYKYIKSNLYLACLKNVNNKKNIFNLSPEEYNGKNILLSPINALNYNNEINNLGKKFITNDKISFNNFEENSQTYDGKPFS